MASSVPEQEQMVMMGLYLANSSSKSSGFAEVDFFLVGDFPTAVVFFLQTSCLLQGGSGLNKHSSLFNLQEKRLI